MRPTAKILTNDNERFNYQNDILLDELKDNPYFKKSSIASRNKALKTSGQNIIAAINEIYASQNTLANSVKNSLNTQYSILGDVASSSSLMEKLKSLSGGNLIETLYNVNQQVTAIQNGTKDLVFVVPKLTYSVDSPAIYFPYKGIILDAIFSIGPENTVTDPIDATLQVFNESTNAWKDLFTMTIDDSVTRKRVTVTTAESLPETGTVILDDGTEIEVTVDLKDPETGLEAEIPVINNQLAKVHFSTTRYTNLSVVVQMSCSDEEDSTETETESA